MILNAEDVVQHSSGMRENHILKCWLICRDFDRRPAAPQPVVNAWGAHSPVEDRVVDFMPQKSKMSEVEEHRRAAAEIKREVAAKKLAKAQAAAAAQAQMPAAASAEDDLFWDYGPQAAAAVPAPQISRPVQVLHPCIVRGGGGVVNQRM